MKTNVILKTALLLSALLPAVVLADNAVIKAGHWKSYFTLKEEKGHKKPKDQVSVSSICIKDNGEWYTTDERPMSQVMKGYWSATGSNIYMQGNAAGSYTIDAQGNATITSSGGSGNLLAINQKEMSGTWEEWFSVMYMPTAPTDPNAPPAFPWGMMGMSLYMGTWVYDQKDCPPEPEIAMP